MKYIKYIFLAMVFTGFLYFLAGQLYLPSESPDGAYYCEEFDADWTWIQSDGTRVPVEVPGKCDVARNEPVTIETTLPQNLEHISCLQFMCLRQDVAIYIDGVLRQEYSTKDTRLFGKTSSAAYVTAELLPSDAGKTITVTLQSDSPYSGVLRTVYCGDKMSIWMNVFHDFGSEVVVAFVMLILGISTVIISIALNLFYHKNFDLEYLGWGTSISATWILFNSMFRQLLFSSQSVASDITFLAVMLLPLPFLLYMNSVQKKRYEKWYILVSSIVVINMIICISLQVTNTVDFSISITYILAVCLSAIAFLGFTIICDIVRGYAKEYRLIILGITGTCLMAVAQVILYFNRLITTFSGIMVAFGLVFLLFIAVVSTIQNLLQLENEKKQAILANQAKATFLANMSHEIRTPINAVLGMDEMILRESREENIISYAKDIQSSGKTLLSLINDILDFSKIESGKMEIIPIEYDLSSLLNDCYSMIAPRAEAKNLDFRIENSPLAPRRLLGDEIRIRQIILNLLTNAVKYTPKGSVVLSINGKKLENDNYLLQISVTDTGIGISEENLSKLFQSFQRIDEQKNRHIEGTGLGLTITKQLIDLMNGTISVESEYGTGSVFRVELPQISVCKETLGDFSTKYARTITQADSYHESFHAPQARILVVDDVPMNLKVIKSLLKDTQVQVDTAESGEQCLAMVKEHVYHIIFMDHMMPGMDGIETLYNMQQLSESKNADTPVIMLTANAIAGAKEEYLNTGFVDYLAKPVDEKKLEEMIIKYLPDELISTEFEESAAPEPSVPLEPSAQQPSSSFLEMLDFLDTAAALSYCRNDENLYREILLATVNADYQLPLNDFFEKKDWANYRIQIHSIKSVARSIGATDISEKAKALEDAAKAADEAYITEHHDTFVKNYENLLVRLAAVL